MIRRPQRPMPAKGSRVTFDSVPDVASVEDLFALAIALEREAAGRYEQLTARMEAEGEEDLAALFRKLQQEEAGHETGLETWAAREGLEAVSWLSFAWDSPEAMTDEDVDQAGGAAMSPWQALAIAVRNEERAYAFYVQIAAKASSLEVRRYAESMAREELQHVAMLRLERRRAWRGEYSATQAALPAAGPPQADSADALTDYACRVELEAAGRLRTKAVYARDDGNGPAAELFQTLAEEAEARARTLGAAQPVPEVHVAPGPVADQMREEEKRLSRLYEGYMRLTETNGDSAVQAAAQEEISVLLGRQALLRDERARLRLDSPVTG